MLIPQKMGTPTYPHTHTGAHAHPRAGLSVIPWIFPGPPRGFKWALVNTNGDLDRVWTYKGHTVNICSIQSIDIIS